MVRGSIFSLLFLLICVTAFSETFCSNIKESVAPYLMSDEHPIKSELDQLFSQKRASFNLNTLSKAGFDEAAPRKFTRLIVTRHPQFPGYIFKLYLDVQRYHSDEYEYKQWIARIEGANLIRDYIEKTNTEHLFCVPLAWIYQIPAKKKCPEGYIPKDYMLIEEDMRLLSSDENDAMWSSDNIHEELLTYVHGLIGEVGLDDCLKPDNLPFGEDGRIAFIDTESYGNKVKFKHLIPFLSEKNKEYWKKLIKK